MTTLDLVMALRGGNVSAVEVAEKVDQFIAERISEPKTLDAIASAMTDRLQTYYEAPLKVRVSK